MKRTTMVTVLGLLVVGVASAQQPQSRTLHGYVVAVDEGRVTVSNLPLAGAPMTLAPGQTFVMRQGDSKADAKAKDAKANDATASDGKASDGKASDGKASGPQWTAAASEEGRPREKKMTMVLSAPGSAPLELTEFQTARGAVQAADYPTGTPVTVTWIDTGGSKQLQKLERREEAATAK